MVIKYFVDKIKQVNPNYEPKFILDVGSRDLGQSIEFTQIFPNAKILAFEPNPQQYDICVSNAKQYPQIEVYPYAASSQEGEATFYVTPSNIGASSLLQPTDVPFAHFGFHEIHVKTICLDKFLESKNIEKIDVVWMDIQGGEVNALNHFTHYLPNVDFLQCEATEKSYYVNHPLKNEVESIVKKFGFECEFYYERYHPYGEGDLICINKKILT